MRPLALNDTMGIARVSADYICKSIVSAVATIEEIAGPSSRLLVSVELGMVSVTSVRDDDAT